MDLVRADHAWFSRGLLVQAGHLSAGVKRLLDGGSGRFGGSLLETHLIFELEDWARDIASGQVYTPRAVLLVGT